MLKHPLLLMAALPLLAAARNCSYPFAADQDVGWQPGASYRGTWSIISNCLLTIVACTWSIQHLNVPARKNGTWAKTKRKIKWMLVTVFFPEWILIHSAFQFYMALITLGLLREKGKDVEWPWWCCGLLRSWLPYNNQPLQGEDPEKQASKTHDEAKNWTITHCYFANMGGYIKVVPRTEHEPERSYPVTAKQLAGSSFTNPPTPLEDIEDKSKQAWLAKLLAAAQILQLILSLITRKIQGAAFSQLETVTLCFAVCGVLIYYSNFYKPQDIGRAVDLNSLPSDHASKTASLAGHRIGAAPSAPCSSFNVQETPARGSELEFERDWDSLISIMLNRESEDGLGIGGNVVARIPNDNITGFEGKNNIHPVIYLLALASGLFGALHAIAWAFEFPTANERLLWQTATVVSAATPVVGLLTVPLAQFTKPSGDPEVFMGKCLQLLREFSWQTHDQARVMQAIEKLEEGLKAVVLKNDAGPQKYADVFSIKERRDAAFVVRLAHFLALKGNYADLDARGFHLHHDKEFVLNFRQLVRVLLGNSTKRLSAAANTRSWPTKQVIPLAMDRVILYVTMFLYCYSRLILMCVAVSSIRKMPGSVYMETNWTWYMPKFTAGGG